MQSIPVLEIVTRSLIVVFSDWKNIARAAGLWIAIVWALLVLVEALLALVEASAMPPYRALPYLPSLFIFGFGLALANWLGVMRSSWLGIGISSLANP
jgi:hypothetical protein